MAKGNKPDWAERKLIKELLLEDGYPDCRAALVPFDTIAKLLHAERQRAVSACCRMARQSDRIRYLAQSAYVNACADCATAIGGGK